VRTCSNPSVSVGGHEPVRPRTLTNQTHDYRRPNTLGTTMDETRRPLWHPTLHAARKRCAAMEERA